MAGLVTGMPQWIGWAYGAIAAVSAVTDYRSGKIYNLLTFPAILAGFVCAGVVGTDALIQAFTGFGLATAIFLPMFVFGILGGGDVKLLMALGTVLGGRGVLELSVVTILIAGAGAFVLLFVHRRARIFFTQLWLFLRSLFTPGLALQWPKLSREIKAPFGIAIFFGFVYTLVAS